MESNHNLSKKIPKNEIIERFRSGDKSDILFLLNGKYLECLTTREEKEDVFYKNNERLRKLLNNLLKEKGQLLFDGISIVKSLIRIGDVGAKHFLEDQIISAFNLGDIFMLDIYDKQNLFYFFDSKEREIFYYKNNKKLRSLIEGSLEHEEYSLKFGFPLLLILYNLKEFSVKKVLRKGVMKWLFSGSEDTIKTLIEKYIRPTLGSKIFRYKGKILEQQVKLFNYEELKELCEDSRCPLQLRDYWNDYKKKFDKIYCFMKEKILTREELLRQNTITINKKLPNSKFCIVFDNERIKKRRPLFKPINTNKIKKIIINSSECSLDVIINEIEKIRFNFHVFHEEINCIHIEKGLIKNLIIVYLLHSKSFNDNMIKDNFTSISNDIKFQSFKLKL